MSEKKLQDYLPFYIGCKCMTPDGIGTLVGLPWHVLIQDRATIHFGKKMIKTVNSIDGGYNKVRNHGDYALFAKRYEPIGSEGITEDGFDVPGGIKPILRRLEDITDEEDQEYYKLLLTKELDDYSIRHDCPESFHYLLKQGFDLFGLLDSGLAIDSATLPKIN